MIDPAPPDPIAPFVSSTTAPVFALRNLPEEVAAVLFAYYSRSPDGLRTALREMVDEGFVPQPGAGISASAREKAEAFHRKWTVGYGHGCYDGATEVLTEQGWVAWPELAARHRDAATCPRLATLNPETGVVEYLPPVRLISAPYAGEMYRVDAFSVDLLVTPNHRMWVCPTTTRAGRRKALADYRLTRADELGHTSCAYMTTGQWAGPTPETMDVAGERRPAGALLAFVGFFVGDGHRDPRYRSAITFRLRRKRKIAYLHRLCAELGFTAKAYRGDRYYVTAPGIGDWFERCYTSDREKVIPHDLLAFGPAHLWRLYEGLLASDGHTDANGFASYATTSAPLRDQLYELALKIGMCAYARTDPKAPPRRPLHVVQFNRTRLRPEVNKTTAARKTSWVPYDGTVYCAEMPRNHTLYVRRNGVAVWCGNSVGEHAVLHIGIEGLSCLAAKAVEDCRLGTAFTEKSTRYVPFTEESALSAAEIGLDPSGPYAKVAEAYDDAVRGLMRAYLRAVDAYTTLAPEGTESARRAWALDRARQLLPIGTKTSLGLTVNGRALRAMVRKLRADPHPEVQLLADRLAAAGSTELPGLLADCPPAHPARVAAWAAVYEGRADIAGGPAVGLRVNPITNPLPRIDAGAPLPRAFERVTVAVELQVSYAAWRDIQRHRVFSAAPVRAHYRSAVELIDAGLLPPEVQSECLGAIGKAVAVAALLTDLRLAPLAEYVLPMGVMVRASLFGNLRGLAHLITLRSGKQGHDSYRTVAQQLHQQLTERAPDIAAAIPCDYEPRDFARK